MEAVEQVVLHTPWWVLALFAFLISRGVMMSRPARIALPRLLIVPAIFLALGLSRLTTAYTLDAATLSCWLAALALGTAAGFAMLRGVRITVEPGGGVINRPGDHTVLPIMILAFLTRYVFAAMAAMHPDRLAEPGFVFGDIGLSGIVSGLFVGKMLAYLAKYRVARLDRSAPDSIESAAA